MKKHNFEKITKIISLIIFILSILIIIYLYKVGILTDQEKLELYIESFGLWAPLCFILIQIAQAVVPILPGGITCIVGVVLFGANWGFIYNYIGICLGSIIAFGMGRLYGRPLIEKFFENEKIEKFDNYLCQHKNLTWILALLILLPGLPDDLLCYLVGNTKMKKKTFFLIIFIGKIPSLLLYSLGLYVTLEKIFIH